MLAGTELLETRRNVASTSYPRRANDPARKRKSRRKCHNTCRAPSARRRVSTFAPGVHFALDDLGLQLCRAFDVRHHPHDEPSIPFGKVGSEGRASKVHLPGLIDMTNLVEDRRSIEKALHGQRRATIARASRAVGKFLGPLTVPCYDATFHSGASR